MDAKELAPEPDLEQLETAAQALVRAAHSGEKGAKTRLTNLRAAGGAGDELSLARDAIAHEYAFDSWTALSQHVEALRDPGSVAARFESALDALVQGDEPALRRVLDAAPAVVTARSDRKHRATLLHYVAANEVEDYRQKTPHNIIALTKLLIERGADADAQAEGGGTPLEWVVTSVNPAQAGVQSTLAEVLIDAGAAVNGVRGDCSPMLVALSFGYVAAAETLAARGARVDDILTLAALGRLEPLEALFEAGGTLKRVAAPVAVPGLELPLNPPRRAERALIFASTFGRTEVVNFLLRRGVSPRAQDGQGFTALHWAAWKGHADVIDQLLRNGAPLEAKNAYGGTVLDATVWAARHAGEAVDYVPIVQKLLAAGADASAVGPFPTGHAGIDELLRAQRRS